jgi:hypothetical protein
MPISTQLNTLTIAIRNGNIEKLTEVLEGHPLDTPIGSQGSHLLKIAITYRAWKTVDFLLDRGESLEKNILDGHDDDLVARQNALFYVLQSKTKAPFSLVEKMARKLQNINETNYEGKTVLFLLMDGGYSAKQAIIFLELGADLDQGFLSARSLVPHLSEEFKTEFLGYLEQKELQAQTPGLSLKKPTSRL